MKTKVRDYLGNTPEIGTYFLQACPSGRSSAVLRFGMVYAVYENSVDAVWGYSFGSTSFDKISKSTISGSTYSDAAIHTSDFLDFSKDVLKAAGDYQITQKAERDRKAALKELKRLAKLKEVQDA